jgi:hypothetical protein
VGLAVDFGDPVPDSHVQVEGHGERGWSVQQQRISPCDFAGEVVRQAAVGEGDVVPLLEDDDVGVLVKAAGAGRSAHAAGDASDDDDLQAALGGEGLGGDSHGELRS